MKIPNLQPYDGTTDLDKHLRVYKAQTYIQDVDDATYYQHFSVTLKGVAQKWFSRLSPYSITCF